jgi:mersacidin/lichenicidin family type 2 lantibiotic
MEAKMLDSATVVRAWRDPEFREEMSDETRGMVPSHPSGVIELSDTDLEAAAGATTYWCFATIVYCVTEAMSCYVSCENTYFDGTCGGFSYGCCI